MKALIFFLFLSTLTYALEKIRLDHDSNFIDTQNRKVMFRGFNNVKKSPPFYDENILNKDQLEELKNRGFNIVRLGVIWNAVHLGENHFNETYLDKIEEIVDALAEKGMYVILDMHQDGLSSRYGTYDAMPNWLIDRFPKPYKIFQFPWPLTEKPGGPYWFKAYLTYECQSSFQNLYDNVENALDYWIEFWMHVAKRFRLKSSVLGYELMNEPFAGNFYTNPLLLLPGYAGKHNLLPAYDRLVDAIRKIDTVSLIFYEPVTWGVFTPTSGTLGTGFERLPGSNWTLAKETSVLSYHYYCWLLQTADPSTNFPDWKKNICDNYLMQEVFKASEKSSVTTGSGRILTEFGLCAPDGNPNSINTIECDTVMKKADETFQSWNYWDSVFFDDKGNIIETPMKYFSRCYPRAVSGHYKLLKFDPLTGSCDFTFTYTAGDSDEILELYLPEQSHYSNGFYLTVSVKDLKWKKKDDTKVIIVLERNENLKDGQSISVEVRRK